MLEAHFCNPCFSSMSQKWHAFSYQLSLLGIEEIHFDLQLPINSNEDIIAQFEKVIKENEGIKAAILDHITSPSAILMPVKELVELCHKHGIIAIIDGAHAPGHTTINLEELNADFYTGECTYLWGLYLLWILSLREYQCISSFNHGTSSMDLKKGVSVTNAFEAGLHWEVVVWYTLLHLSPNCVWWQTTVNGTVSDPL